MIVSELPDELRPHRERLHAVVRRGIDRFKREFRTQRRSMTKRSERSNIHDCIIAEAALEYPVVERRNLKTIKIGRYRLRVKMLTDQLSSRNIPTQQAFDFVKQKLDRLFGVDTVGLNIGYVPDQFDVAQSTIWLTQPDGVRKLKWAYELTGEAGEAVMPLPATNPNPDAPAKRRFRAKPDVARRKASGESGNE